MERIGLQITDIYELLYIVIGAIGVIIIVWGVILTVHQLLKLELKRKTKASIYSERESIRHVFAS